MYLEITAARLLNNIEAVSLHITNSVTNWYKYRYPSSRYSYSIVDGGNDMFDNGNIVS